MQRGDASEWAKIVYTRLYRWKWILFWAALLTAGLLPFGVWAPRHWKIPHIMPCIPGLASFLDGSVRRQES